MSEQQAVLFTNDAFYAAFANRDMAAMGNVWAADDNISVIHPGWGPLFGHDKVLESWDTILSSTHSPMVQCREAKVSLKGDVAIVVCYEDIEGHFLIATNIFAKQGARWCMTHHQAAPTNGVPSQDGNAEKSIN
jgi:ketosteroid isomerase-like protein